MGSENLTLPTLSHIKRTLQSRLIIRPASQPMNISQDPKGSAQAFLFQAIELREKLLRKSREEDKEERFSPNLIQRKFLRSLETGLFSEAAKFQLKLYLSHQVSPKTRWCSHSLTVIFPHCAKTSSSISLEEGVLSSGILIGTSRSSMGHRGSGKLNKKYLEKETRPLQYTKIPFRNPVCTTGSTSSKR